MSIIQKRYSCFSLALDEKHGMVYTGGSKSRVFTFPEQKDIKELSHVKHCSPHLSPQCTYVMFFNDPSYMYLYETENLEKCLYHGTFKPSFPTCWRNDNCFLFATKGRVNYISIDQETKKVSTGILLDLSEYMGNPKLQISSMDCYQSKLLLFIERWIPGENNCIAEIDEAGNILVRELGSELDIYDDVRYDRKGGVYFSASSKDTAWCKSIDHLEKADRIIENTNSTYTRVSPDGKYIALATWNGGRRGEYIIETSTFSIVKKFEYEVGQWGKPNFSSDGHYVLIGGKGAQIIDVRDLEKD